MGLVTVTNLTLLWALPVLGAPCLCPPWRSPILAVPSCPPIVYEEVTEKRKLLLRAANSRRVRDNGYRLK